MQLSDFLGLLGGLALFLYGMQMMSSGLEAAAGSRMKNILERLTANRFLGVLVGAGITAVIQSSSATTVMVVGFVNSGLMTLKQAINVIMGANIGTTVTAWILSLAGISGGNIFLQLLKPSSFTPVLALAGILLTFSKRSGKKDTGTAFLGFATLMTGMEAMSGAVSGLREVPAFQSLFVAFENPLLGVLAGTLLTALLQSSSASVGILQALAATGNISYGAAIPIIMGQNIGTCVTAVAASVGANKNARRAGLLHLMFNLMGSLFWLGIFWGSRLLFSPAFFEEPASLPGIAAAHSIFNVLCTVLLLPLSGLLVKLVCRMVPDTGQPQVWEELDERLLATPPIALNRCQAVTADMARTAAESMKESLAALREYSPQLAESVRQKEEKTDHCEDILGSYLVKLSARPISEADSREAAKLLKVIGDIERISDHAVNLLESAEEMQDKKLSFTSGAAAELAVLSSAVEEILDLSLGAFLENDMEQASTVEPLEQVIDHLKEQMRTSHILRLQQGSCTIDAGFIWSDLLTALERTSDHCSNIAGCVMDIAHHNMNLHASLRELRNDSPDFRKKFKAFSEKYSLARP